MGEDGSRTLYTDPFPAQGLITLANALGERVRQGEAIELLWRALEKTNELEGKLGVIDRITQLYLEQRTLIPLDKIPPQMQNAMIAIEDNHFYTHWGLDVSGIVRAVVINFLNKGYKQGA